MKRTVMLLLLLLVAVPAPAAIYQCRDSKGNIFLTDDPDNLPADCSREEVTVREEEEERTGQGTPPVGQAVREPPPAGAQRPALPETEPEGTGSAAPGSLPAVTAPGGSAEAAREAAPEADREVPAPAVREGSGPDGTPGMAERGESAAETAAPPRTPNGGVPSGGGTAAPETVRGTEAQADFEASLDRWRKEAAELGRQYVEAQTAVTRETAVGGSPVEGELTAVDRQKEAQAQIEQFLDRLDASPLKPEEKAAIWRELPPEAIR